MACQRCPTCGAMQPYNCCEPGGFYCVMCGEANKQREPWGYLEASPAQDAPLVDNASGLYCVGCRAAGVSHCHVPEWCGGMRRMRPISPRLSLQEAREHALRQLRETKRAIHEERLAEAQRWSPGEIDMNIETIPPSGIVVERSTGTVLVPPGTILGAEMRARHWTPDRLATLMVCPVDIVNRILTGDTVITEDIANALAVAMGTSAQLWLTLDARYRAALAHREGFDEISQETHRD